MTNKKTIESALDFLSAYKDDLEYQASAGIGMWNMAGNGTPEFKDDEDADDNMATYIRDLQAVLTALKKEVSK